ncbi:amidohydrolase family protein [Pseudochelatococcus sp. G4_1912]|uniref:metal-dependent hydrolase family protein n=1 Tax=Pseudochelatococcus sp. G4_1912 TaxID=3114288 RepID=UPI0039C6E975
MRALPSKYQYLMHGFGCVCHSAEVTAICDRVNKAVSRRSVLGGIAATFASAGLAAAATPATQAPDKKVLLKNARIFDGKSGKLVEGQNVLIEGNRIKALIQAAENVTDAEAIDCRGGTVMPGLIDAHWHSILAAIPQAVAMTADVPYIHLVAAEEAERTLMRGFTTIRDTGGPSFSLKRAIDENRLPGPRIFPSGAMISQTSGHGDFRFRNELPHSMEMGLSASEKAGISAIADGADSVLRSTREQLMLGASQVKIMVGGGVASLYDPLYSIQFTPAEIRAAVQAASDWGTYVCAHVYTSAGIQRALDGGVQCIEHGQLADEETVVRMVDADAWWSIQPFLADEDSNPLNLPEQRAMQKEIAEGTVRSFGLAQKHKAKMAWGTDILFNPQGTKSQGRQLAKTAKWLGNDGALMMATRNNGELLAMSGLRSPYKGPIGVIEPGALADILVIDGNPLEDVFLIADPDKNMKLIMKDGQVYKNTLTV